MAFQGLGMASNTTGDDLYHPEMEAVTHERTYKSFVHFTEAGIVFVACIVASLAVGAVKHAWVSCVAGVLLAHIAVAIGLFSEAISWRAPMVVLILLALMLVFY
jgi:hypothetical protein